MTRFYAQMMTAAFVALFGVVLIAARPAPTSAILYNGLLYGEMGTIAAKMTARGQSATLLWHDQELSLIHI